VEFKAEGKAGRRAAILRDPVAILPALPVVQWIEQVPPKR
jgi:hypothetical protein